MSNNKQQPHPENLNNQFSNTEPLTHAQRVAIANKMTNNKQSSVEWLEIELEKLWIEKYLSPITIKPLLEQAKAMHREEHGRTWDDAMQTLKSRGGNDMRAYTDFDDYYTEKFGYTHE